MPATPEKFVVTDRYAATGTPYPEAGTVCLGQCEGMGCVPIHRDETEPRFKALWDEAHRTTHSVTDRALMAIREAVPGFPLHREGCDGWHFVTCPDCGGTGKRPNV
jgi:hypothetical protein